MTARVLSIAANTFREAVRDRVLYNLIVFALLLVASSLLVGQISIGIEKLVLINLGLASISVFGVVIAIFIGIGLVSKEIDKRTLYTVLARPVRRWEFILGKYAGLGGTLVVNASLMAAGFFAALFLTQHGFHAQDGWLLIAIYFIILELLIVTAITLLFSSFSSPLLSAVFALAIFVAGTFADDLRTFAAMMNGFGHWLVLGTAYVIPNFAGFNVISAVAHGQAVTGRLIAFNTLYALFYSCAALAGSIIIFERRNLK